MLNERQGKRALQNTKITLLNGDIIYAPIIRVNPTDPKATWEGEIFHLDRIGGQYKQIDSFVLAPWYAAGEKSRQVLFECSSRYELFAKIREYCHDTAGAPELIRLAPGHADMYIYTPPAFNNTHARFYLGTREGFNRHFPDMIQQFYQDQEEQELRRKDTPKYDNGARVTFYLAGVAYPSLIVRYLGRKPRLGKAYKVRAENPQETGDWLVIKAERFLGETE